MPTDALFLVEYNWGRLDSTLESEKVHLKEEEEKRVSIKEEKEEKRLYLSHYAKRNVVLQ